MTTKDNSPDTPSAPRRRPGSPHRARLGHRLCLALWRHRGLVAAFCLAAAVLMGLSALAPPSRAGTRVVVTTRCVQAGTVIDDHALEALQLPQEALPVSGLADESVVGQRAAITLEKGTVVTTSMTTGAAAAALDSDERLIEVPVSTGADLAVPGAKVDIVATTTSPPGDSSGQAQVIALGVRVIATREKNDAWISGTNVTLITLAAPQHAASLVVGAASSSNLSIMLSP